ncbi:MAG: RidA family protein [Clostridiales bacterium]|nr:RidA family protein [Clostridiales bacterium]
MNQNVFTEDAPKAIGPYSQGIRGGSTLYVSGQLPIDPKTGVFPSDNIADQTKMSLENVGAILKAAGYDFNDVVKTTVLLDDIQDFGAMNAVYGTYFSEPYPARAAFEVGKLPKNAKVEIEVVAVK